MSNRFLNIIMSTMVAAVMITVVVSIYAIASVSHESDARCAQVHRLTDAMGGIVAFVNQPNPSRTPAQQQAIDNFKRTADNLLNGARPC